MKLRLKKEAQIDTEPCKKLILLALRMGDVDPGPLKENLISIFKRPTVMQSIDELTQEGVIEESA